MSGGIYLIQDDGKLVRMPEEEYVSEDVFQELLASYPDLLAGEQMNEQSPRRWLLIEREIGVPDEEDGGARWSLDHLFLDQDGIPTMVEVKRSSDTRIRREVIGQMLDYAANAVVYWPVETLRARFERRCEQEGAAPSEQLADCFGQDVDEEELWAKVKTNLQAGRVRMVFVADQIPSELRRVVEFMNQQMDPAEVLAVEIKQFAGKGLKTLVPRVLGQTAEAQQKKQPSRPRSEPWDVPGFISHLSKTDHAQEVEFVERVVDWATGLGLQIEGGYGAKHGSLYFVLETDDIRVRPMSLYEAYRHTMISISLDEMRSVIEDTSLVSQLCESLNSIDGVDVPWEKSYPAFQISVLRDPAAWQAFTDAFNSLIDELRKGSTAEHSLS